MICLIWLKFDQENILNKTDFGLFALYTLWNSDFVN